MNSETKMTEMPVVEYSASAWLAKYRPDGMGKITLVAPDGAESEIRFTEVLCDLCNEEIPLVEADGSEGRVWMYGEWGALCRKCAEREGK